jgi:hypothetical protein
MEIHCIAAESNPDTAKYQGSVKPIDFFLEPAHRERIDGSESELSTFFSGALTIVHSYYV